MKRTYASGAQKRNKAAEEKGKLSKLSKLSAWFTPAATATAPDLDTASTLTSTPASTFSSDPPVPDTQAPSPTELLEEIHESATVTENVNVIYDHALTDPGL